jgi:hypothetical protein
MLQPAASHIDSSQLYAWGGWTLDCILRLVASRYPMASSTRSGAGYIRTEFPVDLLIPRISCHSFDTSSLDVALTPAPPCASSFTLCRSARSLLALSRLGSISASMETRRVRVFAMVSAQYRTRVYWHTTTRRQLVHGEQIRTPAATSDSWLTSVLLLLVAILASVTNGANRSLSTKLVYQRERRARCTMRPSPSPAGAHLRMAPFSSIEIASNARNVQRQRRQS